MKRVRSSKEEPIKEKKKQTKISWSDTLKSAYTWLCIKQFRRGPWSALPAEMVYKITLYVLNIQKYYPGHVMHVPPDGPRLVLASNGFLWYGVHAQVRAVLYRDVHGVQRVLFRELPGKMIACLKCRYPIGTAYDTCRECGYKEKQRDLEF